MNIVKKLLYLILPLYIFYFPILFVNADSKAEDELYQKSKTAYLIKDYVGAEKFIKEFVSSYPKSEYIPEALYMWAFVQEDLNASIGMYKDIISKYPDTTWSAKSHFQMGHCYYLQEKYSESAESFREIVVHFMDDELYWQARYWRSKSFMAKGDYDGAIFSLNTMRESKNKEIGGDIILMSLGECYMAKRDYAKAKDTLQSLIKDFPESEWLPSAYRLLGDCLKDSSKLEDAREFYQKVIQNYPKSMEAKDAKGKLDSLPLASPTNIEKKDVSPQLETPFLKKSSEGTRTVQGQPPPKAEKNEQDRAPAPPFKVNWKGDDESKPSESKQAESKPFPDRYFCVQVGAFSSKSSADLLATQLRKSNYIVDVIPPLPNGKALYKVRVGRYKTEAEAWEMSVKLRKERDINSTIVVPNR